MRISILILLFAMVSLTIFPAFASSNRDFRIVSRAEGRNVMEEYKHSYALIIGVSKYTDGWPQLHNIPMEINGIKEALEDQGFIITQIDDPDGKELREALQAFICDYGYDPDNRLLFFFSGHGYSRKDDGLDLGYLLPANAPSPDKDLQTFYCRALSMGQIVAWCQEMTVRHALFIFDSCFSGTVFNAKVPLKEPAPITKESHRPVRQFITAGGADETVPDKSEFVTLIKEALRIKENNEADDNQDGFLTGTELGKFLQDRMTQYNKAHQKRRPIPQYGKIDDLRLDDGDFVFELPRAKWGRLLVNTNRPDARVRILNIGPKYFDGIELKPGKYHLEISAKRYATHTKWITLVAGEDKRLTIDLEHSVPIQKFTNNLEMEFVHIAPEKPFMMGGHPEEKDNEWGLDEKRHQVTLTKGYYLQTTEVTQGQWQVVMGDNPSGFKNCGEKCPVENVSWDRVQEFIKKLNNMDPDVTYRLPTEAEWEYGARAGSDSAFAGGVMTEKKCRKDSVLDAMGWYCFNSNGSPHPVGRKSPNAFKLYDMHGNVWEWCQDLFDNYPNGSVQDPKRASPDSEPYYRVYRGGSWAHEAHQCRSAFRSKDFPGHKSDRGGFRLAAALKSEEKRREPDPPQGKDSGKKRTSFTITGSRKGFKNRLGMEFVDIDPGEFIMGSPQNEGGSWADETQHLVRLTQGFYMQITEVTQGQWQAVMGDNPSKFQSCGKTCPVENVSLHDVQAFIQKLNQKAKGIRYRLPTEAEWEYAARAHDSGPFAAGNLPKIKGQEESVVDLMGWCHSNSNDSTHPVAMKFPNAWRLHDMHGNVWEWCRDWYGDYPTEHVVDPQGPASGERRVLRGGAGNQLSKGCRSAFRNQAAPSERHQWYGFRLVAVDVTEGKTGVLNDPPKFPPDSFEASSTHRVVIPFKNSFDMEFVPISPGNFQMGSLFGEKGREKDEKPHPVKLRKGYCLQTTEVTQGQWLKVMRENPSTFDDCGPDCPVENVSWEQVQEFIKKLNQIEAKVTYRLPTEAEWEYAARSGSHSAFAYGDIAQMECNRDSVLDGMGWYCFNSGNSPHPVALKYPNAWGLYDMHGNVSEWCQDRYRYDNRYSAKEVVDFSAAPEDDFAALRVIRGGSWKDLAEDCRSAGRFGFGSEKKDGRKGFRLAFSWPDP